MGIVKLFSKNREKNTRRISLKYDQRRHSSMSYFTAPPSIYNAPADAAMSNRLINEPNGSARNRDSALMLNTPAPSPKDTSSSSSASAEIQNTPKPSRKSESKQPNNRLSQHSKRRSTAKTLSLYDLKCTCDTPSTSSASNHRASAPFLDAGISNKYEFVFKGKSEKDPMNYIQPESALDTTGDIDHTLYSELLSTQLSLKSVLIKSSPQTHRPVEIAINRIGGALEMASSLESRLKTVIEISKKTILDKAQQIQYLENQLQTEKDSLDTTLQENKVLESKLKEVDETIKQVEFLLLESQIEPTKEEGGTLLQRIESLLAISTASGLLNDKLRLELETSDTRVRELFNETAKLRTLVKDDDQKLKQEEEICHLQTKVYDLEKNVTYLTNQLESKKDTIRRLKDENRQKTKQLSDSHAAFRKKKDVEFCNNIIKPETVQHENRHFAELHDEDSLTAWQEIAQNRLQLGGFDLKSSKSSLVGFHQSDTEQQRDRFLHADLKQSFSGFLESSDINNNRKGPEKQVDSSFTTELGNKLEKINDSIHHQYNLVNKSSDTIQYTIGSKRDSLDCPISFDQYASKNSQNMFDNNHGLKTFYSAQDIEDERSRRSEVHVKGYKSESDLSLNIHKKDMGKMYTLHESQISGAMHPEHQRNVFNNKIFKGEENDYPKKRTKKQEELIRIHTRAQLGLIEFLEGENNVSLAISRFRKQLENEMNELEYLN